MEPFIQHRMLQWAIFYFYFFAIIVLFFKFLVEFNYPCELSWFVTLNTHLTNTHLTKKQIIFIFYSPFVLAEQKLHLHWVH